MQYLWMLPIWNMHHLNDVPPILFQIQDGSWHQSRFFFHTQDSRQLPIVDIQEFPTSQPNSQQHIEMGPVCFFWHQHHCRVTSVHELLKCEAEKTAAYQRASIRLWKRQWDLSELPMSDGRQTYMEELNVCGTSRPRRPKENSVYQYLSIIV